MLKFSTSGKNREENILIIVHSRDYKEHKMYYGGGRLDDFKMMSPRGMRHLRTPSYKMLEKKCYLGGSGIDLKLNCPKNKRSSSNR